MRTLLASLLALFALACGGGRTLGPAPFALTLEPAQVRLPPGLSGSLDLTLRPEPGFEGTVTLSLPALEPGLQAKFTPAALTLTGGQSARATLRLSAEETLAPGRRTLVLEATDEAGRSRTLDLALEVPAATFFTVITYRGADPGNFTWLAYQDGDGAWTAVPGNQGTYRLPVTDPAGRFGVLLGDPCTAYGATTWITNGFFASVAEVQLLQAMVFCNPQPGPSPTTYDLTGRLSGARDRSVLVSANSGLWSFQPGSTDYAMLLVKGMGDLVAAAYPSTVDYLPSRLVVERARDAQAPATRNFDFVNEGAVPPALVPIQRPALAADEAFTGSVQWLSGRGQTAILGYGRDLAAYAAFPPALVQSGDAWVYGFQADGPDTSRGLQAGLTEAPGALAPRLPAAFAPFDLTSTGGALPRLGFAWSAVEPTPSVHEAVVSQALGRDSVYAYLFFGRGWHRGAARLQWTQPDLTAIPGFDPAFLPRAGVAATVNLYQSGSQTAAGTVVPLLPQAAAVQAPRIALPGRPVVAPPVMRLTAVPAAGAALPATAGWSESWFVRRRQSVAP